MASERDKAYATAIAAVARAEGELGTVQDELFNLARALGGSEELLSTLTDIQVPVERRQQIVEDLLSGKVSKTTRAVVSMVVAAGRARDLSGIADELVALGAAAGGKEVAVVRSAIDLTDDQKTRLAAALQTAVGKPVEVRVVIDPSVLGGLVAQVGDTVIDGSVRRRLDLLKQAI
ncbi:MAG TPA: ATP synthase F1 subunit delta [Acidimicrobiales bacterium]|nr:ATP synthase F1 subunit delta [Acidimicrobiales bacterium]